MNITVLDLEQNQPSGTIIEIGAVACNLKSGRILDRYSTLVYLNEVYDPDVQVLTGIKQEWLKTAPCFPVAAAGFWSWFENNNTGHKLWSWGPDHWELKRQSLAAGVQPPRIHACNAKDIASFFRLAAGGPQKGGLANALSRFEVAAVGPRHRALPDAEDTAVLMCKLFKEAQTFFRIKELLSNG